MFLGILSLVLVTILTVMQFSEMSPPTKIAAKIIGTIVILIGIAGLILNEKEKEFTISSLKKIATSIDWYSSTTRLELANKITNENYKNIRADIKIYSAKQTILPVTANITMSMAKSRSILDDKLKYYLLNESDAKAIFNAFAEADGSIYLDKEKYQKVQNLFQLANDLKEGFYGADLGFKLEYGPDAHSPYTSLADLNNTFVVACIQMQGVNNPIPLYLNIKLKTNIGDKRILFPIKPLIYANSSDEIKFEHVRYVGIFIPERYFEIVPNTL